MRGTNGELERRVQSLRTERMDDIQHSQHTLGNEHGCVQEMEFEANTRRCTMTVGLDKDQEESHEIGMTQTQHSQQVQVIETQKSQHSQVITTQNTNCKQSTTGHGLYPELVLSRMQNIPSLQSLRHNMTKFCGFFIFKRKMMWPFWRDIFLWPVTPGNTN